jgi:hypothetical protein
LKTINLTIFAASILLLGACAGTPKQAAQPAKVVPPPTDVTLDELNIAIENGVKLQNEKGEEVLCRREKKIGTRLSRETICMTKAEWLRVSEESQRATKKSIKTGGIPHGSD